MLAHAATAAIIQLSMIQPPDTKPQRLPRGGGGQALVLLLFFASGASALAYEIIWMRQLSLVFGVTVFALSAVLCAFMGGLAMGSVVFGRVVDARPRWALALYGWMEIAIALYALALPGLIQGVMPIAAWARLALTDSFWLLSLVKLGVTLALLLPATVLMGGTCPVLVKHCVTRADAVGKRVAWLYAANTLGATVGCFATTFFIIAALGVRHTLWLASAVSFGVGVCALVLHARSARGSEEPAAAAPPEESAEEIEPATRRVVLWAFAFAGFCALAYETLWTRMLAHLVGNDVQAFGAMLSTFLVGLAIGSFAVSRLSLSRRGALAGFAIVEAFVGCGAFLSIAGFAMASPIGALVSDTLGRAALGRVPVVALLRCALVMLAPAVLMGAAFPLASRAITGRLDGLGRGIGALYGANTLGAVAGSVLAGFVLTPFIGVQRSIFLLGLVNVGIAVALASRVWRHMPRLRVATVAVGIAVALVVCGFVGLEPIRRPLVFAHRDPALFELIYYREGISSNIAVLQSRLNPAQRELSVNGDPVSFTNYDDVKIQKLLAHLPLLLHPEPKKALLVGFGSGCTSYSVTLHQTYLTCIELERGEIEAAQFFREQNHDIFNNPYFQLRIDDGRNWLLTVPERYDVISRDTLRIRTSQDLLTREFYEICKSRLAEGGLLCGVIPVHMCPDEAYFKMLLRTFMAVFPHASLWYGNPQICLVVGSRKELRLDPAALRQRMAAPGLREDLAVVDMADPAVFLSYFLMADGALREYVGEGEISTDDRPLGFSTPVQKLPPDAALELTENLLSHKQVFAGLSNTPAERADRVARRVIRGRMLQAQRKWSAARRELDLALALSPQDANARRNAAQVYDKLAQRLYDAGKKIEAVKLLERAVQLDPTAEQPLLGLATCYEEMGMTQQARAAQRRLKGMKDQGLGIRD